MRAAGLVVQVRAQAGDLRLDVDLAVDAGEVVAVVGPNGAGKSTLLRVVAGLHRPSAGQVTLDGRFLDGPDGHLDPSLRGVGVVFQDHLLFGHLSAAENVAFGPRARGWPRATAGEEARRWLDAVGLADRGGDRPGQLSGGQQQRVALARALAGGPACLLLDEPLSALDAETRTEVRSVLRRHLGAFAGPVLLVTHEPVEALALADRLVVLEDGRITQAGTPEEVARRPRSAWVARLVGINLLHGTAAGDRVAVDGGGEVQAPDVPPAGRVLATVHPRAVALHRQRPTGSPRNVWQGHVADVEIAGDRVRVAVTGQPSETVGTRQPSETVGTRQPSIVAEVTPAALADLDLAAGGEVWVAFKAADVDVYPA